MNGMRRLLLGAVIGLALTVGGVASAATLNVDQAFSESDPANQQFKTIPEALTVALSGDTIQVAGGDYNQSVTITKGVNLQGSGPQYTHQNMTITVSTTEPVSIKGFNITAIGGDGIVIPINSPIPTTLDIRNNCIVGNTENGISITGSNTVNNIYVINNTISNNARSGIYATNNSMRIHITNNIIINNSKFGIYLISRYEDTVSGNDVYNNTGVFAAGACAAGNANNNYCNVTDFTTTVVTNNLNTDPKFVNQSNGNYTLDPSSPCRNYGQNSPSTLNPDGTRNDIGAYGGPGAASFWPYGNGPLITDISATPMRVEQNGTITINATAKAR